jgi:hypothetical protein
MYRDMTTSWLALVLLLPCWSTAFMIQPRRVATLSPSLVSIGENFRNVRKDVTLLHMSEGEETPAQKRKRKRRKTVEAAPAPKEDVAEEEEIATPVVELKARESSPVQLQVRDVRELVGGASVSASGSSSSAPSSPVATTSRKTFNPVLGSSKSSSSPSKTSYSSSTLDDSMERLLEDARSMKDDEGDLEDASGVGSVKATIGKAVSTIVTADFFLVMVFFVWFMGGIFCSSVLKDDTVQIAFNSKFRSRAQ